VAALKIGDGHRGYRGIYVGVWDAGFHL